MTLLLKILLFYGWGGFLHSKLQLNPIHHTASLSTDLATPAQARAGQCQHCWHLYLVGPDRGTDPLKGIFVHFKVLQWHLAQRSVLRLSKTKSTPNVMVGSKKEIQNMDCRPLLVGQIQVQWLLHSTPKNYFLGQCPRALPKSLWFVETGCQVGNPLAWEKWYFDTLRTVQRSRVVSNNAWRGTGTTWEEISAVKFKICIDSWRQGFLLASFRHLRAMIVVEAL